MPTRDSITPTPARGIGGSLGLALVVLALGLQDPAPAPRPEPERIALAGIENLFRLSPRLYSGGDPHGAEGLRALRDLGIRTILSVDGAMPDVEASRPLGLRYVHLPVGYDGIPRAQAVRIVQALETLPGPVYIHCHHGKHRGPTAAALAGMATEGWTADDAVRWLRRAGTAPDYGGLYATARSFVPPTAGERERAGPDFPERTTPPALVEMMVAVDERWDRLGAGRRAGFQAPPDHPDLDPAHEALQLVEQYRELARLPEASARGPAFLSEAQSAERHASALEAALRKFARSPTTEARRAVEAGFTAAGASCTTCHAAHRNNR